MVAAVDKKRPQKVTRSTKDGSQLTSKSKLKKKLRDIERTLRKENLPVNIRVEKERAVKALKLELEEKEMELKAATIIKKYRMIRFFERKKALRKYKQALKAVKDLEANESSEKKDLKKAKKVLRHCEVDLAYVVNFPKIEKYIALYPNDTDVDANDPNVKKGVQETEKKRQLYKKQFEKMMDDGTLPIKIEDVIEGKNTNSKSISTLTLGPAIDAPEENAKEEEDEFFD